MGTQQRRGIHNQTEGTVLSSRQMYPAMKAHKLSIDRLLPTCSYTHPPEPNLMKKNENTQKSWTMA